MRLAKDDSDTHTLASMHHKTNRLLLGFALGILTLLVMGQSKAPIGTPMRFMLGPVTGGGIYIIDSQTGVVKFAGGRPESVPAARIEYGQPFYP